MLRVGLTGDLGSGKSTVARMFAERGAVVLSSDEMARAMMQPGQPVFAQIVAHFGPGVLALDGTLDRGRLAELAFSADAPRVAELNAIIHPAVLAAQAEEISLLARARPDAIVVVESALILNDPNWRDRFDRILVVTAPEAVKIARFAARVSAGRELGLQERSDLEAGALRRLHIQQVALPEDCQVIHNNQNLDSLSSQVQVLWMRLQNELLVQDRGKRK